MAGIKNEYGLSIKRGSSGKVRWFTEYEKSPEYYLFITVQV